MKKLVPIVFLVVGLGAGAAAGLFLAPNKSAEAQGNGESAKKAPPQAEEEIPQTQTALAGSRDDNAHGKKGEEASYEYLKLTKQFVVPLVEDDRISALVTVSLSLEAQPGNEDTFYRLEPKLRDAFLQVLFDHANMGGFDGAFTHSDNMETLRRSLLEAARKDLGDEVNRVLIVSMSRQDT